MSSVVWRYLQLWDSTRGGVFVFVAYIHVVSFTPGISSQHIVLSMPYGGHCLLSQEWDSVMRKHWTSEKYLALKMLVPL